MKIKHIAFGIAALLAFGIHLGTQAQEVSAMQAPRVVSPEIGPNNTITFRVLSETANAITINGSWMNFGQTLPLTKGEKGVWSVTIDPLPSSMYHYNFFVDGVAAIDPTNPHALRDGTRYASLLMVPGAGSEIFQLNDTPQGNISHVWYHSASLDLNRRLYVYTPPGYESSKESYPVLYLLHGGGGDEDAWTSLGRANHILDNLIASSKVKPMIVVMTNGNSWQTSSLRTVPGLPQMTRENFAQFQGKFEKSLVEDVVPFIEKQYRVKAHKDSRALAGLSMGGAQTITASITYPGTFGYIGVFSSGIFDANADMADLEKKFVALKNSGVQKYWVACGKDDFLMDSNKRLLAVLDKSGLKHEFFENEGGHTWANWRTYLALFTPMLFK